MWNRLSRKKPMIAARTAAGLPDATARRKAGFFAAWCKAIRAEAPRVSASIRLRPTSPIALTRASAQSTVRCAGSPSWTRVRVPGKVCAGNDTRPAPPKRTAAPVSPRVIASNECWSPTDRT